MPSEAASQNPRVVFMGSPDFAVPSLERLIDAGFDIAAVYTQPDRPAGRGGRLAPSPIKRLAAAHGLPVVQPERLRAAPAQAELAALRPDLIVVVAFGQILPAAVLAAAPAGVLNVHPSLLPRYRGASPVASAMLDGLTETGVTVMLLDEGMDTGPLLAQRRDTILPEDNAGSLSARLALIGADLLIETISGWLGGKVRPHPQDPARATLTRRINKDDGVLDWNLAAREVLCRIRAYTPWPGAVTNLDGTPVQILSAWSADVDVAAAPGDIVPLPAGSVNVPETLGRPAFAVSTGHGLLLPLLLQRAGRRPLPARDFANGERGLVGRHFAA